MKRGFALARLKKTKGSVTVEASIVLPLFICVIVSIVFFMKVVKTYEIIQHAISQSAVEMSSISYLFYASGLEGVHDAALEGMQNGSAVFREHADTVVGAFDDLKGFGGKQSGENEAANTNLDNAAKLTEDFKKLTDMAGEISQDPAKELKNIAGYLAMGTFDDLKTEVCVPLVKLYMKKYLMAGIQQGDMNARLKRLGVKDGLEGLDFDASGFFQDENDNIEIVVKYRMELPIPLKFFQDPLIIQRAEVKAWMGGDEPQAGESDGQEEDIWSLTNFQRGKIIRKAFGANLPDSFPVISKFQDSTAVLIKSMDLTSDSYQKAQTVKDTLEEYIDNIAEYKGQEKPWGSSGIVIPPGEIDRRELLLVIPENPINETLQDAINACKAYAASRGVTFKIERYRYKQGKTIEN